MYLAPELDTTALEVLLFRIRLVNTLLGPYYIYLKPGVILYFIFMQWHKH